MNVEAVGSLDSNNMQKEQLVSDQSPDKRRRSKSLISVVTVVLVLILIGLSVLIFQGRLIPKVPSEALVVPIVREDPSVNQRAIEDNRSQIANDRAADPLTLAPDPRLIEQSRFGIIPKISSEGLKPREMYSRPMVWSQIAGQSPSQTNIKPLQPANPKIGIIITGAGLGYLATVEALIALPANITFAFSPYANNVGSQAADARRDGHEIMLEIPMDSLNPRLQDPGRMALLTELETGQNLERLSWVMSRFSGYFAAIPVMGERFLSQPEKLSPILQDLSDRGLAIVSATESPIIEELSLAFQLPFVKTTLQIDSELDILSVRNKLTDLEKSAKKNGYAIGTMRPVNLTIRQLETWIKGLADKGIDLVPVSSILLNQDEPQ